MKVIMFLAMIVGACAVESPTVWVIQPEPPNYPPQILLLHGDGQTGATIAERWRIDGEVLTPEVNNVWNASTAYGSNDNRNDIAALVQLIDPRARAIVMGEGNGAFMAWRLVCQRPDVFGVAVMLNGAANATDDLPCVEAAPVSTLHVHGTHDPIIQYGGGQLVGMKSPYPSVADSIQQERAQSGCTSPKYVEAPSFDVPIEAIGCDYWERGHHFAAEHWRAIGWDHNPALSETWGPAVLAWAMEHR